MWYQRQVNFPNLRWLVALVTIFTFAYCLLSIYLVPAGKPAAFNFHETGSITTLSAIYLSLGCGFAIASNIIYHRAKGSHEWLWVIIAIGLGFLAFDELLQFHERGDRLVFEQLIPKSVYENWNDMVVVAYGVVGLIVLMILLPRLLRYRMVLAMFITAFIFYVIHTTIDTVQTEQTLTTDIFEESAKLFCGAFLALGAFAGFIGNIWQHVEFSTRDIILSVTDAELPRTASYDLNRESFSSRALHRF
jgi:hypothetical protein